MENPTPPGDLTSDNTEEEKHIETTNDWWKAMGSEKRLHYALVDPICPMCDCLLGDSDRSTFCCKMCICADCHEYHLSREGCMLYGVKLPGKILDLTISRDVVNTP